MLKSAISCLLTALVGTTAAYGQSGPTSSGTGFFINSYGWAVTNAHVVEGCRKLTLVGVGEVTEIKTDRLNDLAAVRVTSAPPGQAKVPIRARSARLGEDAAALGFPLSTVLSSAIKITTGNVNSLLGINDDSRYLQISAPIQPGNSGGPLVDNSGALIGVLTATLKSGIGDPVVPQNVNFAIRASVVTTFLSGNGISFDLASETAAELRTADLADLVAPAVVAVHCFDEAEKTPETAARPPEPGVPEQEPSSKSDALMTPERKALAFALAYHDAWSSPNVEALQFMSAVYRRPMDFYGKFTPADKVLDDKRKFAERWPVRGYILRPDSLSVDCNGYDCSVSGTVDWFAYSPTRNKKSSGVATLRFGVDTANLEIKSESSAVIKGAPANPIGLLERWADQNGECRGGSGDSEKTLEACEARNYTDTLLHAVGWCYGRYGEAGYQMEWHLCSQASLSRN